MGSMNFTNPQALSSTRANQRSMRITVLDSNCTMTFNAVCIATAVFQVSCYHGWPFTVLTIFHWLCNRLMRRVVHPLIIFCILIHRIFIWLHGKIFWFILIYLEHSITFILILPYMHVHQITCDVLINHGKGSLHSGNNIIATLFKTSICCIKCASSNHHFAAKLS